MNKSAAVRKGLRRPAFLPLSLVAAIAVGLAALFANGLFYQVMFVPVIFAAVYAASCLCFEIWEDLTR